MVPPRVNIYFRFFLRVPCRLSEVLRALRFWFYGKYWLPKAANLNVILEIRFWIYGKYRNPKAAICDCENLDGFWNYEKYRKPQRRLRANRRRSVLGLREIPENQRENIYAKARLRFRKNVFQGERGIGR